MKFIPALVVSAWLALAGSAPAWAGTLYKCVGADGVTGYSSRVQPGAQCQKLGSYSTPKPAPKQATSPSLKPAAAAAPAAAAVAATTPTPTPAPAASVTPATARSKAGRVVSGQLYAYMQGGVRHYSSRRPAAASAAESLRTIAYSYIERCYACGEDRGLDFSRLKLNTSAYQQEIASAAHEFGVDEALVRAVIHAESAFNPTALSRAGAQGLMQLMPATASRFNVGDAFDAAQNIRGGVRYLAWLLQRFHGDISMAAAGYNAGEGAVQRYQGIPPYPETQRYSQRVAVLAERYRQALSPAH